jgi:hypothetical protein
MQGYICSHGRLVYRWGLGRMVEGPCLAPCPRGRLFKVGQCDAWIARVSFEDLFKGCTLASG